jgi:2-polyprenyl-3-methyl-5-hydroxy-6-metoxy-1,4-benzoquinol methylase
VPHDHEYIGLDQWEGAHYEQIVKFYEEWIALDWHQLQVKYPWYVRRIEPVCSFSSGIVLEIGCGMGNVTKWMNEVDAIKKIYAIDLFEKPILQLTSQCYSKVTPICCDVTKSNMSQWIAEGKVDTIVLCEFIEHMPQYLENEILKSIRKYIRTLTIENHVVQSGTKFVVGTPIGFMPDPNHCRGFSKKQFITHLEKHYGIIDSIHYNGIHQTACGWFH